MLMEDNREFQKVILIMISHDYVTCKPLLKVKERRKLQKKERFSSCTVTWMRFFVVIDNNNKINIKYHRANAFYKRMET